MKLFFALLCIASLPAQIPDAPSDKVADIPVDAHMLTAPRPLLLQTGVTDKWSDPKGEYLAALAAAPVYKRFGQSTPLNPEVPPVGQSVMTTLGYQMHQRGHGMIPADWDVFLQYMRTHFKS